MRNKKDFGVGKLISMFCVSALMAGCSQGEANSNSRPDAVISESQSNSSVSTVSVSSDNSENSVLIRLKDAEKAALSHAGIDKASAEVIGAKLEPDDGIMKYVIEFVTDTEKYDYDVNATDGKILRFTMEKLSSDSAVSADGDNTGDQSTGGDSATIIASDPVPVIASDPAPAIASDPTPVITSQPAPEVSQHAVIAIQSTPAASVNDTTTVSPTISETEAKNAALNHAGVSAADVMFTKSKLEYDNSVQIYDIEFTTSIAEYDYEIRASDGAVLEFSADRFSIPVNTGHHYEHDDHNYHHNGYCISEDAARHACLDYMGFSSDGVSFIKTEYDSDDSEYDFELTANGIKYEIKVDALTGAVLESEIDD